ncbi:MAG: lipocalin family protein [bacterium]
MAEKGNIRNPLKIYMGGPWALIIMALVSVTGVLVMLALRSRRRSSAPEPVDELDMEAYSGTWYEIARIPTRQNLDCIGNVSEYTLQGSRLRVRNTCTIGTFDGPQRVAKGLLWRVDPNKAGRMKVRLGLNIAADYWVIDKAADYSWSVVLGPDRMRLRIFCREPQMPESLYQTILRILRERGVNTTELVPTPQPEGAGPEMETSRGEE